MQGMKKKAIGLSLLPHNRYDSHVQWLTGRLLLKQDKEEGFCFVFSQYPSFICQGYFLICSLFILTTPHLNTLYAAKVLITSQFFIYILHSFTLPMKWHGAWGRVRLTCFHIEVSEALSPFHKNNYFATLSAIGQILLVLLYFTKILIKSYLEMLEATAALWNH